MFCTHRSWFLDLGGSFLRTDEAMKRQNNEAAQQIYPGQSRGVEGIPSTGNDIYIALAVG